MGQLRRISFCTMLMSLASVTSALSFNSFELLDRSSGCSKSTDIPCGQGLPSNFCCGSTTVCLALAGKTTALCCPDGQSCADIQIISCDISLQNATAHPENALKTTDLSGSLPLCGTGCCPFGYSCSGNSTCTEDANQNLTPEQTASVSSPASSSTSISSTLSTAQSSTTSTSSSSSVKATQSASKSTALSIPAAGAATTSPVTISVAKCSTFPAGAVLAGFFPGLVLGIILTLVSFYLLHRRRLSKDEVSGPVYDSSSTVRTDFLRKTSQTPSSSNPSTPKGSHSPKFQRVAKFVHKSFGGGHSGNNNESVGPYTNTDPMTAIPRRAPLPPSRTNVPQTPMAQRATSGVSINIFAAPDISTPPRIGPPAPLNISKQQQQQQIPRDSHQTSIDDFLAGANVNRQLTERADLATLRKGEPFVQQPVGHYTHERKASSGSRNLTHQRNGSNGSRGLGFGRTNPV